MLAALVIWEDDMNERKQRKNHRLYTNLNSIRKSICIDIPLRCGPDIMPACLECYAMHSYVYTATVGPTSQLP